MMDETESDFNSQVIINLDTKDVIKIVKGKTEIFALDTERVIRIVGNDIKIMKILEQEELEE